MTQRPNDSIRIINPIDFEGWDEQILRLPGSSFFHSSAWAKVLSESYGYKPTYFTLFEDDKLIGLLPIMDVNSVLTGHRGVSLPFTDYCRPVARDKDQFQEMFNGAINFGKQQRWKYLEIRGGEDYFPDQTSSEWFYGHTLDLTAGSKKIYSNLRDSTKRNLKKAEKEKVRVTISTSLPSIREFCRLNTMTRREHGLPPQPYSFFQNVHKYILSKNKGFIALAFVDNIAIAANVYFCFGKEVIYKYGASDKAFQSLRASNLVMWESIQWSCDHDYQTLCFGRTEPENKGLMQFKEGWGVKPYQIYYYRYDLEKNIHVGNTSGVNPFFKTIFHNLPLPTLNGLGRILYRHMG